MIDALGTEIEEGDLCINVAGGYIEPAILVGGLTASGNPRIKVLNLYSRERKRWVETHNLIKATPEQFINWVEEKCLPYHQEFLQEAEENLERFLAREDAHIDENGERQIIEEDIHNAEEKIEKWRTKLEEILTLHREIVEAR